jgi:hypothetical protein
MFFKTIFPSVENCLISNSGLVIFHLITYFPYFPLWDKYYGIKGQLRMDRETENED